MNADIGIIEKMLDTEMFDSSAMRQLLSHYQEHPAIIPYTIFAGSKIIRSSTNDTKEFHENVSRLNYPPVQFSRTDRASLKGKPMFYGTVFTSAAEKNNAYPRIFSAMETTDILRDFQREGKVFTTQSLWLPDRDLHLFAFPFSESYNRPCDEVAYQWKMWEEKLSQHWPTEYCEFSEYMGDLMAQEARNPPYERMVNSE